MSKINTDSQKHEIFVGMDVHTRNWNCSIYVGGQFFKTFHQPPEAKKLCDYLRLNFPECSYSCAYEAGKFGFQIQRNLSDLGISCMVVHPSDIPFTQKDKLQKTDVRDSRSIAHALSARQLKGIYVPSEEHESFRALVRTRKNFVNDLTRTKNRIKAILSVKAIAIPEPFDNANWSKKFIFWLESLELDKGPLKLSLLIYVDELKERKKKLFVINKQIREYLSKEKHQTLYKTLLQMPGIGMVTAATLIGEIWSMGRFQTFDQLNSYVGMHPMEHSSGEQERKGKITVRRNRNLRSELVEAAWITIRNDPAMMLYFDQQLLQGKTKKRAIIKVARKLLSKIRFHWQQIEKKEK